MEKNNAPLWVKGLEKTYPAFHLEPMDFALEKGTVTGLIGRNGAGKTTALNAIMSFVKKDAGDVRFFGKTMEEQAGEVKARIGFVSAGMTYYTRKKLRIITAVTRSFYPTWDQRAYENEMRRFGLDESKTPAELSNGMKIKYALALALSHGAELMILDEPTSGLDPISREELNETLLALRDEGKTVLFSTHITSDLEKCADRILFIRSGRLFEDRSLESFSGAYRLTEWEGDAPEKVREKALGLCRVRKGYTALLTREDAEALGTENRLPTLDEIMTHLDREEEKAL